MIIHPATPHDAHSIAKVHVSSWQTAYRGILPDSHLAVLSVEDRADRWREILGKPEQFTFVAEIEGQVVGFINGGPERSGDGNFDGEVYALYLLEEHRGQGIGRKLFQRVASTLLDRGMTTMLVWVLERNPYRSFYERMGGEIVARKTIEIGGQPLEEVAYGWRNIPGLVERKSGE